MVIKKSLSIIDCLEIIHRNMHNHALDAYSGSVILCIILHTIWQKKIKHRPIKNNPAQMVLFCRQNCPGVLRLTGLQYYRERIQRRILAVCACALMGIVIVTGIILDLRFEKKLQVIQDASSLAVQNEKQDRTALRNDLRAMQEKMTEVNDRLNTLQTSELSEWERHSRATFILAKEIQALSDKIENGVSPQEESQ